MILNLFICLLDYLSRLTRFDYFGERQVGKRGVVRGSGPKVYNYRTLVVIG